MKKETLAKSCIGTEKSLTEKEKRRKNTYFSVWCVFQWQSSDFFFMSLLFSVSLVFRFNFLSYWHARYMTETSEDRWEDSWFWKSEVLSLVCRLYVNHTVLAPPLRPLLSTPKQWQKVETENQWPLIKKLPNILKLNNF